MGTNVQIPRCQTCGHSLGHSTAHASNGHSVCMVSLLVAWEHREETPRDNIQKRHPHAQSCQSWGSAAPGNPHSDSELQAGRLGPQYLPTVLDCLGFGEGTHGLREHPDRAESHPLAPLTYGLRPTPPTHAPASGHTSCPGCVLFTTSL